MSNSAVHQLLLQLAEPFTGEQLFDHLADVVFFIKNAAGEYSAVNRTLVQRCGVKSKAELLGRTPSQLFRAPFGERYQAQDAQVIKTGRPLLGQLEMHRYPTRDIGWCLTTKLPLLTKACKVIGLVGVSQDVRLPDCSIQEFRHVAAAITFAESHLADAPSVTEMASVAGMSRFQIDRRMRTVFGVTTGQWLQKIRIDLAQRLLTDSDLSIAAIAMESGYSDQSAFTRQFRQATGLSPREFRTAQRN